MPKGPQGQKRSASPIQAAIEVAQIATGERKETPSNRKVVRFPLKQKRQPKNKSGV